MLLTILTTLIPLLFFYNVLIAANNLPQANQQETSAPTTFYETSLQKSIFPEEIFEALKLENHAQEASESQSENLAEATATSSPTPTQPAYTPIPTLTEASPSPTPTKTLSPKDEGQGDFCNASGGTWNTFGNSCVDSCLLVSNPFLMCLQVVSEGCDCGADKCWDGASCVPNPHKGNSIPSATPTPKPTDSPKQAPSCGNNICEEGEADFSDCPICSDTQEVCPLRPCIFQPGSCPKDCS